LERQITRKMVKQDPDYSYESSSDDNKDVIPTDSSKFIDTSDLAKLLEKGK